jgi:hypothetical protein
MARPEVLNRLKELGWDGPTSYTLPTLNEFIEKLEGGMSIDELKATRKKTSSPDVKGQGRQPKGEWVTAEWPWPDRELPALDGDEVEVEGERWRHIEVDADRGVGATQRFVPTVKQPKAKAEKGTWEACENPGVEVSDVTAEYEKDGVRYRLAPPAEEGGSIMWEKFVPTPKKAGKLKGEQQANFDPREMLRVFENQDMRVRTGGRDWTMVPVEWLEEQLAGAKERGDAAIVVDVDGSQEACDVVILEALVAVKKRLALREVNDGTASSNGSTAEGDVRVADEQGQATSEA